MRLLRLHRLANIYADDDSCTLGLLSDGHTGKTLCKILELPWCHNLPNISRIPQGVYRAAPHVSPKCGPVLQIEPKDVAPRTHILFHAGNTANDTRGCLLPGTAFGAASVKQSRIALADLRRELTEAFVLHISDPP